MEGCGDKYFSLWQIRYKRKSREILRLWEHTDILEVLLKDTVWSLLVVGDL